ncbi:PREDICTED: uncharacterized protein LOC109592636, partial [Amphimedon queenslandica]|uniref:Uncharacterized protein n=1 Tax=Amphimedon queenslandica TaxID=400682 RepID=A0AAN0K234_AMPQE
MHSVFIELISVPSPHCEKKLFVKDKSDGSVLVDDEILSVDYKNITLKPHKKYRLSTEVKNLRGKVEDTEYTDISTYNVQDVLVSTYTNGSVSVQCVFVPGSRPDGCYVTFTHTVTGKNDSLTLTGSDDSTLIALPTDGVYDVYVYDIVNRLLYGPAVQLTITATGTTSSTTVSPSEPSDNTELPTSQLGIIVGSVVFFVIIILLTIVFVVFLWNNRTQFLKPVKDCLDSCKSPQHSTNQSDAGQLVMATTSNQSSYQGLGQQESTIQGSSE